MPKQNLRYRIAGWRNHLRVIRMARQVAAHIPKRSTAQPVVFFNASTRITGLSQNAAFALLFGWALRLSGIPVRHFVCQAGMSHCVLGTNREDYRRPPPCQACIRQSRRLYVQSDVAWFTYRREEDLAPHRDHRHPPGIQQLELQGHAGRHVVMLR